MNSDSRNQAVILRGAVIVIMILLAAALRLVPHPWNLAPIGAIALFSGSMFRNRWIAFLLPLASLFVGDVFVGFHKLMLIVYASFAVSVAIGRWLGDNRTVTRIGSCSSSGSHARRLRMSAAMTAELRRMDLDHVNWF